jgi:opacity protein-like surface antigen
VLFGAGVGFAPVEWLVLGFRTELSGFGIGTGAELAWKWLFGVKWHPLEVFSLTLGWRYALLVISRGSADDAFESHATCHGPYLGLGFHF